MTHELFLASASPRRRELIAAIGIPFVCASPEADETVPEGTPPRDAALLIARRKAEAARSMSESEGRIIVSADTIVVVDGQIFGKPSDRQHAASMLRTLSGREHQVMTGVCVILPDGTTDSFCECTGVRFYPLSDEEIERYIDSGEPMDKAGAYGIQGIGKLLVEGVSGDYFNVVGLPVAHLKRFIDGMMN
ncbi:MAG: septum formation protein Maf [Ruminococcaceae bacterium]|nr:septum formation protein Maf [Oscillospiraceae bacterium]